MYVSERRYIAWSMWKNAKGARPIITETMFLYVHPVEIRSIST